MEDGESEAQVHCVVVGVFLGLASVLPGAVFCATGVACSVASQYAGTVAVFICDSRGGLS
jgi:hypothetical protein